MESTNITSYSLLLALLLVFTITLQAFDQSKPPKTKNSTTVDPYKLLHIIPNSNGTITRIKEYYPTVTPNTSTLSFSKDTPLNLQKNTWARIYLPKDLNHTQAQKLPIIVYAHGGGFIVIAASPNFDSFCAHAASRLGALVVSVEYRLAPEHRLPAAFDDVLEALHWVKARKDTWVRKYGDISMCILMGESAGGNIAYNVGLQASTLVNDLNPLVIKGLVLIQPFFGGLERSGSELRLDETGGLPLVVTDLMWEWSLPIGANRNHMYCNPFTGGRSSMLEGIRRLGWRVAVAGCNGDPLFDRQVELAQLLKIHGVDVTGNFSKGDYHGVFVTEYSKAEKLFGLVISVFSPYVVFESL